MMKVTRFPERASGPAERIAGFVAHLRANGLRPGPGETEAALAALTCVPAHHVDRTRSALKSIFTADSESWRQFDALFDAYWFNHGKTSERRSSPHVRTQSARPKLWQNHFETQGGHQGDGPETASGTDGAEGHAGGMDGRLIASRSDNLQKQDLRELMDEDSLRRAARAAHDIALAIRNKRSRRMRRAEHGKTLDLRRIQRSSLARGGEPLDLHWKKRHPKPLQLVALTDVSGSMNIYARVFLSFIKGLIGTDKTSEAFLFHTRLMRVTPALRDNDSLRAAARLSLMAEGFGGGTDIGGALTQFRDQYGQSILNRRSVVLIMSDGYCTGAPDNLAQALDKIQKKARRVVWLNPLKGWKAYAPVAAGMAAASPYLDAHLAAASIEDLAALEPEFARL